MEVAADGRGDAESLDTIYLESRCGPRIRTGTSNDLTRVCDSRHLTSDKSRN